MASQLGQGKSRLGTLAGELGRRQGQCPGIAESLGVVLGTASGIRKGVEKVTGEINSILAARQQAARLEAALGVAKSATNDAKGAI